MAAKGATRWVQQIANAEGQARFTLCKYSIMMLMVCYLNGDCGGGRQIVLLNETVKAEKAVKMLSIQLD